MIMTANILVCTTDAVQLQLDSKLVSRNLLLQVAYSVERRAPVGSCIASSSCNPIARCVQQESDPSIGNLYTVYSP